VELSGETFDAAAAAKAGLISQPCRRPRAGLGRAGVLGEFLLARRRAWPRPRNLLGQRSSGYWTADGEDIARLSAGLFASEEPRRA